MSYEQAVVLAIMSSALTMLGKIVFDWLKSGRNGNGKSVQSTLSLERILDRAVENQKLLKEILDELRKLK